MLDDDACLGCRLQGRHHTLPQCNVDKLTVLGPLERVVNTGVNKHSYIPVVRRYHVARLVQSWLLVTSLPCLDKRCDGSEEENLNAMKELVSQLILPYHQDILGEVRRAASALL